MEPVILNLPFKLNGYDGVFEVQYEENTDPEKSGFILLKQLGVDPNMCLGYPTMHAYIKQFSGYGISRYCAWIQVLNLEFHSSYDSLVPENIVTQVDATPTMKEIGFPFFAYGFPAEIYDPPVTNYTDCKKLIWNAYTFLVTMPSFLNGDTISFITGFQWGYIDHHVSGSHHVEILPIKTVDSGCWNRYVELLKSEFPKLNFSEHTDCM